MHMFYRHCTAKSISGKKESIYLSFRSRSAATGDRGSRNMKLKRSQENIINGYPSCSFTYNRFEMYTVSYFFLLFVKPTPITFSNMTGGSI